MSAPTPDATILGLLASAPRHGYDLVQCFQDPDGLGRVWQLSTSQIYAVLHRLRDKGLIEGRSAESGVAPPRTVFELTPRGENRLQEWLYDPMPRASIRAIRVEFLSRMHVAHLLGVSTQEITASQRRACERQRRILEDRRASATGSTGHLAEQLVAAQMDAVIRWLDTYVALPTAGGDMEKSAHVALNTDEGRTTCGN